MHNTIRIGTALASLISLVNSLAIAPRDEDFKDVIRYMKCANLVEAGTEWGMAAHYRDGAAQGGVPAGERAIFPMYTKMQDYFYNHKGHVYGADTAGPDARIWVDFDSSPPELAEERFQYNSPENGIYLGKARYTPLDGGDVRDIIYNCHTDSSFQYTDEQYGKCKSHVTCTQSDGIHYASLANKKQTEISIANKMGSPIPNAKAIYEKVKNQWNQGQGLCDSSKLDIEGGCQVSFECSVNDNKDTKIMDDLINRLLTLAEKDETFNGREEHTCSMKGTNRESCQYYQKLDLPSVIQFRVTSIPHSLATTGHERARLKAEVTCPPEPTEAEKWCSAIKTLFGFGGSFPGSVVPAVGAAGGAGAEAICGGLLW